ncbi:hypothetical protein CM15mP43_09720 [bacterium]|nr:MAG: hypothetical protein CM15mP43_09720 [bacterium]
MGLTINSKIKNHSIKSINKFGTGTGGSRLVTGTSSLHCDLENVIAKFKKHRIQLFLVQDIWQI